MSIKAYHNLQNQNYYDINDIKDKIYIFDKAKKAIHSNLFILKSQLIPSFFDIFLSTSLIFFSCGIKFFIIQCTTYGLYIYVTQKYVHIRSPYIKKIFELDNKSNFYINESLLNNQLVQQYQREDHEIQRYKNVMVETQKLQVKNKIFLSQLNLNQRVIMTSGITCNLIIGVIEVMNGNLSTGTILLIMQLMNQSF